jgi:hypothetical protein
LAPCAVWLIVRVRDEKQQQPRYVRLEVEYFPALNLPRRGFPVRLVEKSREWQFMAVRSDEPNKAIERWLKMMEGDKDVSEDMAAPAWELLPGAENERIPVGEVWPNYYVKADRYKPHGKNER